MTLKNSAASSAVYIYAISHRLVLPCILQATDKVIL